MTGPRYYVALTMIALGAIALGLKGALDPLAEHRITPIAVPLSEFPMEIAGWQGQDQKLTEAELDFIQPDDYVRRVYRRGSEYVNLLILYHGNKLEGLRRIHHNPTICLPASGWTHEQEQGGFGRSGAVVFNDVAKSVPLSSHYFTAPGGKDYLVTVFFSVDGVLEAVHRRPKQEPLQRLVDRLSESWRGPGYCIQVQIGTTPAGDPEKGYQRTIGFLRDTIRDILRHFPARVDHE